MACANTKYNGKPCGATLIPLNASHNARHTQRTNPTPVHICPICDMTNRWPSTKELNHAQP